MTGPIPFPPPHETAETRPWWDGLARGEVVLRWCDDCDRPAFPPRATCPTCWGEHLSWRPSGGRGRVVTYAVVHRPGHPAFVADGNFTIAVVELDEGVRVTMTVRDQHRVVVGQRVVVATRERDGVVVPVADPLEP